MKAFIGFPLNSSSHTQVRNLLNDVYENNGQITHKNEAGIVLMGLVDLAVSAYYSEVMNEVRVHPEIRKSTDGGISTIAKGARLIIKKVTSSLTPEELILFAEYLDSIIIHKNDHYYLVFQPSQKLVHDVVRLTHRIHDRPDTETYNQEIITTLCRMIDEGINSYYSKPSKLFRISPTTKKSADLGVKTVHKGIHFIVRQLFKSTAHRELLIFAKHLESRLIYAATPPQDEIAALKKPGGRGNNVWDGSGKTATTGKPKELPQEST